jgi:hypothetical protein
MRDAVGGLAGKASLADASILPTSPASAPRSLAVRIDLVSPLDTTALPLSGSRQTMRDFGVPEKLANTFERRIEVSAHSFALFVPLVVTE